MWASSLGDVDRLAIIDLTSDAVIAQGKRRRIYWVVSENGPTLLKVPDYAVEATNTRRAKRVRQRIWQNLKYRVISKDAAYERRMRRKAARRAVDLPIPVFKGYARTSQGHAAVWQAICAEDGSLAPTLREIASRGDIHAYLPELNAFIAKLFELNVVALDFGGRNIVLATGTSPKFFLVDGFGDPNIVPFKSIFPSVNQKRLHERAAYVAGQSGLKWVAGERKFAPLDATSA